MKSIKIVLILATLLSFGCQKAPSAKPTAANVQADPNIQKSFDEKANQTGGLYDDKSRVVIKKEALGKEFILSANVLMQTPTPGFNSLQSRIVSFELKDNKVVMLDVTGTNKVGEDNIEQKLLITEFDIIKQDEKSLEIDFNGGMRNLFINSDMQVIEDTQGEANYSPVHAESTASYLDEVKVTENALFIRQVALLSFPENGAKASLPVEARYQIKAYQPDASFKPFKYSDRSKVGYFVANSMLLKDGSNQTYAMKWNTNKPIKWYVSANTPQKYQKLFADALKYWNKILGPNAIVVEQLTDKSITAPKFDMNILQWVDYDEAGSAYADAHIDPRTGEITSAQIFMTSAFLTARDSKQFIYSDAGKSDTEKFSFSKSKNKNKNTKIGLKGFSSNRLCERDVRNEMAERIIKHPNVSAASIQKAIEDYAYEVVAHELGHIMGLRHNFAGNLVANYDFKDRKALILDMFKNSKAPSVKDAEGKEVPVITSSSVMEYSMFEESAMNGALMRTGAPALSYDSMAIKHLYNNESLLPNDRRPPFCSDYDVGVYADCERHDGGRSMVSNAAGSYQFNLDVIANRIMRTYLEQTKLPEKEADRTAVSELNISSNSLVGRPAENLRLLLSLLKEDKKFIAIRSLFMPILEAQKESVYEAEQKYLAAEFTRLGGLESMLKQIQDDFDKQLVSKFESFLNNDHYATGIRADGSKYSFSSEEKQFMVKNVTALAENIKTKLVVADLDLISGNTELVDEGEKKLAWEDSDLTTSLAKIAEARFNNYVLAKSDKTIKASFEYTKKEEGKCAEASPISSSDNSKPDVKCEKEVVQKVDLELPIYKYSYVIRETAAGILSTSSVAVDWAISEKAATTHAIEKEGEVLKEKENMKLEKLPAEVRNWIIDYKEIKSKVAAPLEI